MDNKLDSKDGYIEVVSGRAVVTGPTGDGRYASINPCDSNIDVYVNGTRITDVTVVTQEDRVEFSVHADMEGTADVKVDIIDHGMKAVLTIDKSPGRQYYVKDSPKTNLLNVSSGYRETPAPDVTLAQCLNELKKAGVDLKLVDGKAVNMLVGQRYGGSAVVAEGVYPVHGRDSVVEYLFHTSKYRNPDFDTDKKVDLLDHTITPTVKVGEVLAKKVSFALPGKDGQTVTGKRVKARQGKDIPFKAGEGTIMLDNDTKIMAATSGRPMFKNGAVAVARLMIIPNNVDPGTGNIYYDGDIRVKGNVMDNMKVVAEGDITVLGNVLQASLSAGGSINIMGNVISSRVYAGKGITNRICIMPKMQQILSITKADFLDSNSQVWLGGYKNMRRRFPGIYEDRRRKLEALTNDIKAILGLVPEDEARPVEGILKRLCSTYAQGAEVVSAKQIEMLIKEIQGYLQKFEEAEREDAHLRLGYAQNSLIQADGDIKITGRGTYQTDLIAKGSIVFLKPTSVVRGGTLIAGKRLDLGIVGSSSGIKTCCRVLEENGKINATRFFGNTVLNINNRKQLIN